jgi:hypothetical protein
MGEAFRPGLATLGLELAQHVARVCGEFEDALKKCERPALERFLEQADGTERAVLLQELVALEIAYRRAAGEQLAMEDYQARFSAIHPEWLAREIHGPSSAPNGNSSTKASSTQPSLETKIRCPHCNNPLQLAGSISEHVLCPGCGGSFPALRVIFSRRWSNLCSQGVVTAW